MTVLNMQAFSQEHSLLLFHMGLLKMIQESIQTQSHKISEVLRSTRWMARMSVWSLTLSQKHYSTKVMLTQSQCKLYRTCAIWKLQEEQSNIFHNNMKFCTLQGPDLRRVFAFCYLASGSTISIMYCGIG